MSFCAPNLISACAALLASFATVSSVRAATLEFDLPGTGPMLAARANAPMSPQGNTLTYDRDVFCINGRPTFIHAGEIQYARVAETEWEDRILKAKNSGLNCIATYVFWSVVEPVEGVFNFSGRYDLNRFLSLCQKHGMFVILRMGPIANAEMRNGGLPQWIRKRIPGEWNHHLYPTPEWYFDAVKKYYARLAEQTRAFFPSRGGNIILVQIDNETHVSWIWGRKETKAAAQVTINRLQQLAKEVGFEGPFSCTGWLGDVGVMAEGSLPTTGAYPINAWLPFAAPNIEKFDIRDARHHYDGSPLNANAQPVFSVENQGGCTYYGITPDSYVAAYNHSDIAGGVNGTSYYVFSGGTNPQRYPGPYFDLFHGEGGVCHPDTGKMTYDSAAALGEFQETRKTIHHIRQLGFFLNDFGETLQLTKFVAPKPHRILGYTNQASFRGVDGSGFVFINSYKLPDDAASETLTITCNAGGRSVSWPQRTTLTVRRNHPLTLPFRLEMDGIKFGYAAATPLCRFDGEGARHLVFAANATDKAEFHLIGVNQDDILRREAGEVFQVADGVIVVLDPRKADNLLVVRRAGQMPVCVKVLSKEDSLRAYRLDGLRGRLLFTDLVPLDVKNGTLRFEYTPEHGKKAWLRLYPADDFARSKYRNQWQRQSVSLRQESVSFDFKPAGDGSYVATVNPKNFPANAKEVYVATKPITAPHGAELHVDGMLMADTYYRRDVTGAFHPWHAGLKRFVRVNSQQWVVQRQPDGATYRLLNKLTAGALELGPENELRLADCKLPTNDRQLWKISKSTGGSTLENVATGSRLNAGANADRWQVTHANECYSTISNLTAGVVLDAAAPKLLRAPDSAPVFQVRLVGYQFAPFDAAKPSWSPVTYTYGDYVQPGGSSLLMEATVPLKVKSSNLSKN
jgi:hypothetical protein